MVKPGYKQTEIGLIPEDWETSTLETQYNITSSKRVFQSEWRDSGVPFYRAREIAVMGEGIPAPKDLYISEEMYERYSKQYGAIKENDVLITGVGTLGKVYVVKKNDRFYFKDGNIIWLQWNGRYSSQFLKQLYRTPVLIDQIFGNAGGSTVPTYTITNAKATVVPCPEYQEQCEIAEALSAADALIATIEKQISKKKSIKQGAMQELLTGKRRLPGFSGEWMKYQLGSLGVFVKGSGISRNQSNSGNLPAVRYGELYTRHQNYITNYFSRISEEVASKAQKVSKGDILFAASGETKEEIGKCAAIIHETDVYAGGDILIFRPTTQLDPIFMGTLLNTADVCKQRAEKGQGDAVVHIHADALSSINVMLPNIEEQQAIADTLLGMDREIELLESKLGKYRQVKQGMMQQLLTGKIRLV